MAQLNNCVRLASKENVHEQQISGKPFRMKIARKFLISGDVQGVGYRFFAQRAAARHQVLGYVRNLDDGRVEVHAEGEPVSVEAFKNDLATGPAFARVANIEEINVEPTGWYTLFRIER